MSERSPPRYIRRQKARRLRRTVERIAVPLALLVTVLQTGHAAYAVSQGALSPAALVGWVAASFWAAVFVVLWREGGE